MIKNQPLVVSYGVGVDSTAMLVAMHARCIRPDLILFADVGNGEGEKPETYAYIPIINAWLRSVGFPELIIVRYEPTRAPYYTLEEKCLVNETLPSLAFGGHSCSIVFKIEPQNKYLEAWQPAVDAWAAGAKVVKAIGYDNGEQDCRRRAKADRAVAKKEARNALHRAGVKVGEDGKKVTYSKDPDRYTYWYALQEWGIDRAECLRLIESAGLPVPMKSACFFCPASKKSEVIWLRDTHPVLFARAVAMETGARNGRHGLGTVKGLGRQFAWADLVHVNAAEIVDGAETLRP